jgi:hypothetical protein
LYMDNIGFHVYIPLEAGNVFVRYSPLGDTLTASAPNKTYSMAATGCQNALESHVPVFVNQYGDAAIICVHYDEDPNLTRIVVVLFYNHPNVSAGEIVDVCPEFNEISFSWDLLVVSCQFSIEMYRRPGGAPIIPTTTATPSTSAPTTPPPTMQGTTHKSTFENVNIILVLQLTPVQLSLHSTIASVFTTHTLISTHDYSL